MKFKNLVSISNENEDPLKNEKRSLDKALTTGQQKSGTNMYSTGSPHTQQKRRRKRDHSYEKQVSKTTKENTNLQKRIISTRRPHLWTKKKMSKQTNDLSKPFQERKRHRGKEKNH